MQKIGQRTAMSVAAVAIGSLAFAGTALACEHGSSYHNWGHGGGHHATHGEGGNGANGGAANANCAVPVGVSAGVIGQGGDNSQCNAVGGSGGNGGGGVSY